MRRRDKYGKAAIKKILSIEELEKIIKGLEKEMMAAKDLQFERAGAEVTNFK